jgi:hypothetical protein
LLRENKKLRRVELLGHVSMEQGEWHIHSGAAFSDDLNAYVDFADDVSVWKGAEVIANGLESIRFNILTKTISLSGPTVRDGRSS